MNDAEQFEGFGDPTENYSKLPHEFIDALHLMESEAEVKVVIYILRHTWGYQDESKKITTDEFCNGRVRKDGTRIDHGTGLSKPSVIAGLKAAEKHGFILVTIDDKDKARVKKYFSIRGKDSLHLVSRIFTSGVKILDTDHRKKLVKETLEKSSPEKAGEIEVDFFGGIEDDQPVSQPIRERKPKDDAGYSAVMESIEKEFALARGCDLPDWEHEPKVANKRWRMPLARMWKKANQDIVITKTGVRAATKKLIESGMTFDAPDQIEKTFYSWLIDHKNGNGNGAIKEIIIAPVTDNRKTISDYQRIAITGD